MGPEWRTLLIGEVLAMRVRDGIVSQDTLHVDLDAVSPVGRLHGGGWSLRLTDRILMDRVTGLDGDASSRA